MDLLNILQSLEETSIALAIKEGDNLFPWLESFHVLAITLVVGTIAIVDLRLIGYPSHRRGARQLIVELLPFTWVAFVVAVITGSLLFLSNAVKYFENPLFLIKMGLLLAAGINMAIFHLGAYRKITEWDDLLPPPVSVRVAGAMSLCLWIGVVIFGRWIGFS
ncbi:MULTISPECIES: DUF6644 family protein [unclassified Sphingobium]|uniref:DUF6644 family protein n=1 Tax=unclassified Sphingobium TaxID=2611147 RepID=UPI000D168BD9|nr:MULTISPECIES: DUF6644 family protein [unclassified Sphingobium]MBG6120539.1 hypothetical protein [Sphingobium sp. JAI105]PSO10261.1 hypothetical protein C7E20_18325 [Sphingobium sp. AEW4]TWD00623.1 hypothetical protein FB595_11955 [Sphingobium sp. AEW010]TWD19690.1 hypothetical protein FB596_11914 [Sphingobium sp. AEW013]TWD22275.1 hypothetical protein FB594_11914 [Sphingobium sp. AEW001]